MPLKNLGAFTTTIFIKISFPLFFNNDTNSHAHKADSKQSDKNISWYNIGKE